MLTKAAPNTSTAMKMTLRPSGLAADAAKAMQEKK